MLSFPLKPYQNEYLKGYIFFNETNLLATLKPFYLGGFQTAL